MRRDKNGSSGVLVILVLCLCGKSIYLVYDNSLGCTFMYLLSLILHNKKCSK